jgi:hypothetical protein
MITREQVFNLVNSMKSHTLSSLRENQRSKIPFIMDDEDEFFDTDGVLHSMKCKISAVEKYHYKDQWYYHKYSVDNPEKTYGILRVENLPYRSFYNKQDKESFIASMRSMINQNYIVPFMLFIDGRFVNWNDIDIVFDYSVSYLLLHGVKYNWHDLRNAKRFLIVTLPFKVEFIGSESSESFNSNYSALTESLQSNLYQVDGKNVLELPSISDTYTYDHDSYSTGAWLYEQIRLNYLGLLSEDRVLHLKNMDLVAYEYDSSGNKSNTISTKFNALDKDVYNTDTYNSICCMNMDEYEQHKSLSFNDDGLLDDNGKNTFYILTDKMYYDHFSSSDPVVYNDHNNIKNILQRENYLVFRNGLLDVDCEIYTGLNNLMRIKNPNEDKCDVFTFYHLDTEQVYQSTFFKFSQDYLNAKAKKYFDLSHEIRNGISAIINNGERTINRLDIVDVSKFVAEIIDDDTEVKDAESDLLLVDPNTDDKIEIIITKDSNAYAKVIENNSGMNDDGSLAIVNSSDVEIKDNLLLYSLDGSESKRLASLANGNTCLHILDTDESNNIILIDTSEDYKVILLSSDVFALTMNEDGSFTGKVIKDIYDEDIGSNGIMNLNGTVLLNYEEGEINDYILECKNFLDFVLSDKLSYEENMNNGFDAIMNYDVSIFNRLNHTNIKSTIVSGKEINRNLDIPVGNENRRGIKIPRHKFYNHETYCIVFLNGELIKQYSQMVVYHDLFFIPIEEDYEFRDNDEIEFMYFLNCDNNEITFKLTDKILNTNMDTIHMEDAGAFIDDYGTLADGTMEEDISSLGMAKAKLKYRFITLDGIFMRDKDDTDIVLNKVKTDVFSQFIKPEDLVIFERYPSNIMDYTDIIESNNDVAFNVSFSYDNETYIYPQVLKNTDDVFFAVSKRKFIYERLYVDYKSYRIKLSNRFRFCDNQKQYILFINGRRIYDDSFFVTVPKYSRPFWATYLYLTKFVNPEDRVEIFYVPEELQNTNADNSIELKEDGYIETNKTDLDVPYDNRLYLFFINGKKISPSNLLGISSNMLRISKDTKTLMPLVINTIYSDQLPEVTEYMHNKDALCTYDKIINYIRNTKHLGKDELDKLFGVYVKMSDTEDNMLKQNVARIAIINEIVRDFWVTSGYDYHKEPFVYDYDLDEIIYKDDYGNNVLPSMDANYDINILKNDTHILYFTTDPLIKFCENGSILTALNFIWEYSLNIYNGAANINVSHQSINDVVVDNNDRSYNMIGEWTEDTDFVFSANVLYKALSETYSIKFVDPIYYGLISEDVFAQYKRNSLISVDDIIALVPKNGILPSEDEMNKHMEIPYILEDLRKDYYVFRNLTYLSDMYKNNPNYVFTEDLIVLIPENVNDLMDGTLDILAEDGIDAAKEKYKWFDLIPYLLVDPSEEPIEWIKWLKAIIPADEADVMGYPERLTSPRDDVVLMDDNIDTVYAAMMMDDNDRLNGEKIYDLTTVSEEDQSFMFTEDFSDLIAINDNGEVILLGDEPIEYESIDTVSYDDVVDSETDDELDAVKSYAKRLAKRDRVDRIIDLDDYLLLDLDINDAHFINSLTAILAGDDLMNGTLESNDYSMNDLLSKYGYIESDFLWLGINEDENVWFLNSDFFAEVPENEKYVMNYPDRLVYEKEGVILMDDYIDSVFAIKMDDKLRANGDVITGIELYDMQQLEEYEDEYEFVNTTTLISADENLSYKGTILNTLLSGEIIDEEDIEVTDETIYGTILDDDLEPTSYAVDLTDYEHNEDGSDKLDPEDRIVRIIRFDDYLLLDTRSVGDIQFLNTLYALMGTPEMVLSGTYENEDKTLDELSEIFDVVSADYLLIDINEVPIEFLKALNAIAPNDYEFLMSDVMYEDPEASLNIVQAIKDDRYINSGSADESMVGSYSGFMAVLLNEDGTVSGKVITDIGIATQEPDIKDIFPIGDIVNISDPELFALLENGERIYGEFAYKDVNGNDLFISDNQLSTIIAHIDKHLQDTPEIDLKYAMGNHNYFIYAAPKYHVYNSSKERKINFYMQDLSDKDFILHTTNQSTPIYTSGELDSNHNLEPLDSMNMQYLGETDYTNEYGYTERYVIWRSNGYFTRIQENYGIDIKVKNIA